jgi:hypothetical protein
LQAQACLDLKSRWARAEISAPTGYRQTFVDTYSKIAFAKLYNCKTPINAVATFVHN